MTRVIILPQYDLLGTVTEYVVAIDYGHMRLPIAQCERLPEARRLAKGAQREHRAAKVSVEMEEV